MARIKVTLGVNEAGIRVDGRDVPSLMFTDDPPTFAA
jgi:hypothetical protein